MNGIVFGDLEPKPQYYEVKKVYKHIGVKAVDVRKGLLRYSINIILRTFRIMIRWSLYEDGKEKVLQWC